MLLSEDRISHLSHLILKGLLQSDRTAFLQEDVKILREIKWIITQDLQIEEEMDQAVRAKLGSYSRPLAEGSPEWEVLYNKFLNEERQKRKR